MFGRFVVLSVIEEPEIWYIQVMSQSAVRLNIEGYVFGCRKLDVIISFNTLSPINVKCLRQWKVVRNVVCFVCVPGARKCKRGSSCSCFNLDL